MVRIYMDGIFDIFHRGHIESIKKCKEFGDEVIIGIISDNDAKAYKRLPIISENDRCTIIENLKDVSSIIFPAPLIIDQRFIEENNIDYVVHAFNNEKDFEKQKKFFEVPISLKKFFRIDYYNKISTTSIIKKIKDQY